MITPIQEGSGVSSIDYVIGDSRIQKGDSIDRGDVAKEAYNILAGIYIRSGKSIIPIRIEDIIDNLYILNKLYTLPTQRKVNVFGPISDIDGGYRWLVRKDNKLYIITVQPNFPPYYPPYLGTRINHLI